MSVQKFVYDGEVSKIALEIKNLIACVSFMLEQKLVKAWYTDKDAEALKYHILLMEEEEGARRREVERLERKRMKKLNQKEQKSKDLFEEENRVSSPIAEKIDSPHSDFNTIERENEGHHPVELNGSLGPTAAIDVRMDTEVADCNIAQDQMNPRHSFLIQYKPKRTIRNGLTVQFPGAKSSVSVRYGPYKDLNATSLASNKIWTQKSKHEEASYNRIDRIHQDQSVNPDSSEVTIGSILVALGSSDRMRSKPDKLHTKQHNIKLPNGMLWKPVGLHENRSGTCSVSSTRKENFIVSSCEEFTNPVPADETNFSLDDRMDSISEAQQDLLMVQPSTVPILFSSKIAEAFLAQRWKEAIVADHVRLVLPSEVEVFDDYDTAENGHYEVMPEKPCVSNGLEKGHDSLAGARSGSTEKGSLRAGSIEPSNSSKHKFKTNLDKNSKLKYVPKQTHKAMGE